MVMAGTNGEVKSCPLIHFGFGPGASAMFLHDALHRGQPDACAFELFGAMQALKNSEELIGVFHTESCPVVADEDGQLSVFFQMSDLNDRRGAISRVLKSVRDQVLENLADACGVAI